MYEYKRKHGGQSYTYGEVSFFDSRIIEIPISIYSYNTRNYKLYFKINLK